MHFLLENYYGSVIFYYDPNNSLFFNISSANPDIFLVYWHAALYVIERLPIRLRCRPAPAKLNAKGADTPEKYASTDRASARKSPRAFHRTRRYVDENVRSDKLLPNSSHQLYETNVHRAHDMRPPRVRRHSTSVLSHTSVHFDSISAPLLHTNQYHNGFSVPLSFCPTGIRKLANSQGTANGGSKDNCSSQSQQSSGATTSSNTSSVSGDQSSTSSSTNTGSNGGSDDDDDDDSRKNRDHNKHRHYDESATDDGDKEEQIENSCNEDEQSTPAHDPNTEDEPSSVCQPIQSSDRTVGYHDDSNNMNLDCDLERVTPTETSLLECDYIMPTRKLSSCPAISGLQGPNTEYRNLTTPGFTSLSTKIDPGSEELRRDIFIDKYFMPFQASSMFYATIESAVPFSKQGIHGREWAIYGSRYHHTPSNWDIYNVNDLSFIPILMECMRKILSDQLHDSDSYLNSCLVERCSADNFVPDTNILPLK